MANPKHKTETFPESFLEGDSIGDSYVVNPSIRVSEIKGAFRSPSMVLAPGDEIGNFEIRKILGYGGFAIVYLAYDKSLKRNIALKVSRRENREAQTMAQLEHEGIVRVHSHHFDEEREIQLIAMQRVTGTTLDKLLKKIDYETPETLDGSTLIRFLDELSMGETELNDSSALEFRTELESSSFEDAMLAILYKIATALDYAHRQGVLHLDIKPGNILLSPYGLPLLGDFNVAITGKESLPRGGTRAYMPPEQQLHVDGVVSSPVDTRSDIFSLGVVLKEVFSKTKKPIPRDIQTLIQRCTEAKPEHRYPSTLLLAEEIAATLDLRKTLSRLETGKRSHWIINFPFASLTLAVLIPQFAASYISSGYYALRISSFLGAQQKEALEFLHYIYFPCAYALVVIAWWAVLTPFVRAQKLQSAERLTELRGRSLQLPWFAVYLTIASWFPASILFPIVVYSLNGSFDLELFAHFMFSFAMCSLISCAYCYLYARFIVLRVLYPSLLTPRAFQLGTHRELASVESENKLFQRLPILVPLIGATVIALQGPVGNLSSSNDALRNLIISLNAAGIAGIFLCGHIGGKLAKLVATLKKNR